MASCGSCSLCCFVLGVDNTREDDGTTPLRKPPDTWCGHCDIGRGCGIYLDRPRPCRNFECGWLAMDGAPHLRPDKLRLVITGRRPRIDAYVMHVHPHYPDAYKRPAAAEMIRKLRTNSQHRNVLLIIGDKFVLLTNDPRYAEMSEEALRKEAFENPPVSR